MSAGIDTWRRNGVTFAAFDPGRLGVWTAGVQDQNQVTPSGPFDAIRGSGASMVLNGPEFGVCAGQNLPSDQVSQYAQSACDSIRFAQYDASRGLWLPGVSPDDSRSIMISVVGGNATATPGNSERPDGASAAVQLMPTLVVAEQPIANNGNVSGGSQIVWRAALGILRDGRLVFAAGQHDISGFVSALISNGVANAGYTDGGGSTSLVFDSGDRYGHPEQRRVATWLTVGQPNVLATIIPASPAGRAIAAALLVGAAAAGYVWWKSRPKTGGRSR